MKLKEKYIKKCLSNFHYELTREQLEQEWEFDKHPYYCEKECWCLHAKDGSWIEVSNRDIFDAFDVSDVESVISMVKSKIDIDCDLKSSWNEKSLEQIGREDYEESEYYAGVQHEKKVAIEACQKVIDKFYDSNFDPTIDYMKIFKENL
jgi:hypothetical protein